jgi:hypothetical protein
VPTLALTDPLWWVARRLRQFLTGLAMFALAFGAGSGLVGPQPATAPYPTFPAKVDGGWAVAVPERMPYSAVPEIVVSDMDGAAWDADAPQFPADGTVAGVFPAHRALPAPVTALVVSAGRPAGASGQRAPPSV